MTFATRTESALRAGAPIGTAADLAHTATSDAQAAAAGTAFGAIRTKNIFGVEQTTLARPSVQASQPFQPRGRTMDLGQANDATPGPRVTTPFQSRWDDPSAVVSDLTKNFWEKDRGLWDNLGGSVSKLGWAAMDAASAPQYYTVRGIKTLLRVDAEKAKHGEAFGFGTGADWRHAWNESKQGSLGQMAYLDLWGDPVTGKHNNYDLLNNPEKTYAFFEGSMAEAKAAGVPRDGLGGTPQNFSGGVDFIGNFLDPTIVLGAAGAAARKAFTTLAAEDVAKVADRTIPISALTSKQAVTRTAVDDVVDTFAARKAGTTAAFAQTDQVRRLGNGEALSYFINEVFKDQTGLALEEQKVLARDALHAAMGDGPAAERIGAYNSRLRTEIEMSRVDPTKVDISGWLDASMPDEERVARIHAAANDDAVLQRELAAHQDWLSRQAQATDRLQKESQGVVNGRGDLAYRWSSKDLNAVTGRGTRASLKTVRNGMFMRPLNMVSGDYLPHVMSLSRPEKSLDTFVEATERAAVELRKVPGARDVLYGMRDQFVSAGTGATGRGAREQIVNDFNKFVDDHLARIHGLDPEAFAQVTARAARARELSITGLSQRIYKALQGAGERNLTDAERANMAHYLEGDADEVLAIQMDSGVHRQLAEIGRAEQERLMLRQQAVAAEQAASTGAEAPVLRSQTRDLVTLVDAREKAHLARAYGATNGFDGFLRKSAIKGWEWAEAGLSTINNFFKLATLFRPAYALRIQGDTQMRLLATLGPLEMASNAWGGLSHFAYNRLTHVSEAEAFDLEERALAAGRLRDATTRLNGIDTKSLALHESAQARLADLQASKAKDRFAAARVRDASGRAKRMTQAEKDALSANIEAKHAARLAALEKESQDHLNRANLGPYSPEDVRYWQGVQKGARTRLKEQLAPKSGKRVRVGKTVARRYLGQSDSIDAKGVAHFASTKDLITKPYRSADEYSRTIRKFDTSDSTANLFTSRTQFEVQTSRGTGQWHYVQGWDNNWAQAYARAVDWQTIEDALGKRVIAAETGDDFQGVFDWLTTDPEGLAYVRDMRRITGQEVDAAALLSNATEHIDRLLPPGSQVRAAARNGHVSKPDILSTWKSEAARPQVPHETEANLIFRSKAVLAYNTFRDRFFNLASTIPENMIGKHPFFQSRYTKHANEMIRGLAPEDLDRLTAHQIDSIRARAANRARRDVGRYMFDTSRQSNIGHLMRFIAPFYGAWADTMVKWSRIFAENPAVLAIGLKLPSLPNQLGLVTDQDGNLVDREGTVYDAQGNKTEKRINPFQGMISLPGLPKALQNATGQQSLKFSKSSANVIFQGDPFWLPGNGPLVTIPVSAVVNASFGTLYPEDDDHSAGATVMRYFLPYGPEQGNLLQVTTSSLSPSFYKAAQAWADKKNGLAVSEFATLYANEYIREQQTGDFLSDDERFAKVSKQTKNSLLMRFMGTYVAPVSLQNESPLEYYVQQYRQDVSTLGYEAGHKKFLEDYPDYLALTVSLSKNTTGLQANDETAVQIKKYRETMASTPDKAWFWAGAASLAPGFNSAVYGNEMTQSIGNATNWSFRTKKDPHEVATDIAVADGWQKFTAFNTQIQTKMKDLGLSSLQTKRAKALGLDVIKSDFISQMREANPAWSEAYDAQNSVGGARSIIQYAAKNMDRIKDDPMLGHDAWLEYFATRATFQGALDHLGLKSMNSQQAETSGIRAAWDAAMLDLSTRSDAFNVAWSHGLAADDLSGDVYTIEGMD
jgi:hypothetical protein